jgi:2-polyprenyl-3-methyl-5-hydroxy-6-metoxy-1,4-benzoquinol methylase
MAYVYSDQVREDILRLVPEDGRIIGSVGCGYAATEGELVRQGRIVHGVDINARSIEVASTRLTTARVVEPTDLSPFEPDQLDGLILADVLEHMPEAWSMLARYAGFVRPGGWVIVSVPNMRSIKVLLEFALLGDWPEERTGVYDGTHVQVMSRKRLRRWCRAAGLEPEVESSNYLLLGFRQSVLRGISALTFGCSRDWFALQILTRCRRLPVPSP